MYFQLTNAAVAALAINPALRPTNYKLGTASGYVPQATDTNIHGAVAYAALLSPGDIINGNVLRYSILLPKDLIVTQKFGEIGLFTDSGMLFALGVMDMPVTKDNTFAMRVDAYLSAVNTNYETWLDVAETSDAFRMGVLQSIDQLPSGLNATPCAYIVKQGLLESFRAFQSGNGLWAFDEYASTNSTMSAISADVNSITVSTASYSGPATIDPMAPPIIEFTTGFLFSICRQITSIVNSGSTITLGWTTPVIQAAIANDTAVLFMKRPKAIVAGGGIAVSYGSNGQVIITNTLGNVTPTVWRNGVGVPANSLGNFGDYYLNDATGDVYVKDQTLGAYKIVANIMGPQGIQGPQGVQGVQGAKGDPGTAGTNGSSGTNGNTILNGTGTPSNTVGNNGDFFLATDTSTLWGPKAAGAWPGSGVPLQAPMKSYVVSLFVEGTTVPSETLMVHCVPVAFTLPANLVGSQVKALVTASGNPAFVIKKNGTQIGQITFPASTQTALLGLLNPVSFVAGDILEVDGPASPDPTLANIGFTFLGTLN